MSQYNIYYNFVGNVAKKLINLTHYTNCKALQGMDEPGNMKRDVLMKAGHVCYTSILCSIPCLYLCAIFKKSLPMYLIPLFKSNGMT